MAAQRTRVRRLASNLVPARTLRLIAIVAGALGLLLCALTPLLPVKQTTATILWPQGVGSDGLITDVTAPLVYVNYGNREDYEELDRMGITVKGAIVITRYGSGWRGIKPKVAAEHGAVGCLI